MRAIPTLSILAILLAACGGASKDADDAPAAAVVPEGQTSAARLDVYSEIGGDFTLTDHRGRPFRLAETDGKVRLLFFGYAMCPDVCPMTLSKVVQVRRLLGDDAEDVMTLFVSVDPERDTPEKLRDYLGYFDLGEAAALSGTTEEVDAVVDLFKASYEKDDTGSAAGYLINHTPYLFLLDRGGTVRALYRPSEKPEEIVSAIRVLLGES